MTLIPAAAMPVVEVLRRDVKRPRKLLQIAVMGIGLRWNLTLLFGDLTSNNAVVAFLGWWDSLRAEDAAEAMDAIWPRKGRKR